MIKKLFCIYLFLFFCSTSFDSNGQKPNLSGTFFRYYLFETKEIKIKANGSYIYKHSGCTYNYTSKGFWILKSDSLICKEIKRQSANGFNLTYSKDTLMKFLYSNENLIDVLAPKSDILYKKTKKNLKEHSPWL